MMPHRWQRSCGSSPSGCSPPPRCLSSRLGSTAPTPLIPGVIRLPRPDGGQQWPAFQFAPGNGPLPVVRAINTLLDSAADPIGVTDWWLSRNGWLDGPPSELLGHVPDDVLLDAARVVGSEV